MIINFKNMERVKFEAKGVDISNLKIGSIVNIVHYYKDKNEDNKWHESKCSWYNDWEEDWQVVKINPVDGKYTYIKLMRTEPTSGIRGGKGYYPKHRITVDINGVSKSMYCDSAPGFASKIVIWNIKSI